MMTELIVYYGSLTREDTARAFLEDRIQRFVGPIPGIVEKKTTTFRTSSSYICFFRVTMLRFFRVDIFSKASLL